MLGVWACSELRTTRACFWLLGLWCQGQPGREWRIEHLLAGGVRLLWRRSGATHNVSARLCRSAQDTGQGFASCCCAAVVPPEARGIQPRECHSLPCDSTLLSNSNNNTPKAMPAFRFNPVSLTFGKPSSRGTADKF